MRTLGKALAAAALATVAIAGSANAATNLITNGGFVGNLPANSFATVGVSTGVIPGWDVLEGTVDWINGYWPSSDGDGYSIDLDGNSHGKIGQTIDTVIGKLYTLTFDISANKDRFGTRVAIVGANDTVLGEETYTYNGGPISYDSRTLNFVANSTSTTISFASGDDDGNCCWGAAIDNVAIMVPEPGTWALMIMGFGGAGAVLRRRREALA